MLADDTVLCVDEACTLRPQEHQYLVYNPRSDEMHLVSPWGHYILRLCDGLRPLAEIEELLAASSGTAAAGLRRRLRRFLAGMVEQGVLVGETPRNGPSGIRVADPLPGTPNARNRNEPRR